MKNGFFIAVLLFSLSSQAGEFTGLGFTAPSLNGVGYILHPDIGDIVYDRTAQGFYGYNQSGNWVSLGPVLNDSTTQTFSFYSGVFIQGTNTNDSAPPGFDGEFISANSTSAITPAASGSYVNVASITLSAGDWDVEGVANLTTDSSWVGTQWGVQISATTSASDYTSKGGINWNTGTIAASGTYYIPTGMRRISLAAVSTTIYLTAELNYTTLGATAFGTSSFIRARRIR